MGKINQVFAAAGRDAEKIRSVRPAEKEKPARNPRATVITVKIPYSKAYTTYSGNAKNIKANSKGSVTPQRRAHKAADPMIPMVAFRFVVFAV